MREKIRKVKTKMKKNRHQNQKRKKLKKILMMKRNQKVEGHLHQGMRRIYLGWFTAHLAIVFLTELQGPIL